MFVVPFIQLINSVLFRLVQKQMALLLGRDKVFLRGGEGIDEGIVIQQNSNLRLHEYFKELARRLELTVPKSPDDVYKKFLEPSRSLWLLPLVSLH